MREVTTGGGKSSGGSWPHAIARPPRPTTPPPCCHADSSLQNSFAAWRGRKVTTTAKRPKATRAAPASHAHEQDVHKAEQGRAELLLPFLAPPPLVRRLTPRRAAPLRTRPPSSPRRTALLLLSLRISRSQPAKPTPTPTAAATTVEAAPTRTAG